MTGAARLTVGRGIPRVCTIGIVAASVGKRWAVAVAVAFAVHGSGRCETKTGDRWCWVAIGIDSAFGW